MVSEPKENDFCIKKYSYADYMKFSDRERWEIIDGCLYMMVAPSETHQGLSFELSGQIRNALQDKQCVGRSAPYTVIFPEGARIDDKITNVVEPDILVVCDSSKITDRGCNGAPDFIIEILSPSTASRDWISKKELYERNGVSEYWIADPINKIVYILKRIAGKYVQSVLTKGEATVESVGITLNFNFWE